VKPILVPLYGFLEGDTIGLLVLAHDDMTMAELASRLCEMARLRVAPAGPAEVHRAGVALDPAKTVAEAGFTALDRVDVRWNRGAP
jgi:hypothetical protein